MQYSKKSETSVFGGGIKVSRNETQKTHQAFRAYSIAEGETILFYEKYEGNCITKTPIRNSKSFSYLLPCIRIAEDGSAKKSYINLGLFSRQKNDDDEGASRSYVDEARTLLGNMDNDNARITYLEGKSITWAGTVDGYRPSGFAEDETGRNRPTEFEAYAFPSFTINDEKWEEADYPAVTELFK